MATSRLPEIRATNDSQSVLPHLANRASHTTRQRHLRPLVGRPPDTPRLARESTLPGTVHVRSRTHEDQGSRRVSRAPDGRRTTHTAEAPHASSGDTAGPPPESLRRQRARQRPAPVLTILVETLGTSPFGFVWCSGERRSVTDRLSHLSVMKIGRTGRRMTARNARGPTGCEERLGCRG
jgi:hypothetical protein